MKILVLNAGSSSIKFKLFEMPVAQVIASGLVEKIGLEEGIIKFKTYKESFEFKLTIPNHLFALNELVKLLLDPKIGVISNVNEITAIGHRVVHGGSKFTQLTKIHQEVKDQITDIFGLAPLHNPHNLNGINVAEEVFPNAEQIAVFDTSFHQTLPAKVYRFAIPKELYLEHQIRAYGFHGISHQYVSHKAAAFLQNPHAKIISIHLGNGCSMTAVENGKSVDHSMGFGPNSGLVMGTRSGDIDSSVIFYLSEKLGKSVEEISKILTHKSGLLGLSGYSDMREVEEGMANGDADCALALEITSYRIKKYIGAFAAGMNGLDAVVFTAGIGENSSLIRKMVCEDLDFFGIKLDDLKNDIRSSEDRSIAASDSKAQILVIPTNEELEIANACYEELQLKAAKHSE